MYGQTIHIRVPAGRMTDLRRIIQDDYLPVLSHRPGFVSAYLMEQCDDEDAAQLILFWDSHAAAETFARTGSLANSLQALAATMPGTRLQRQGYIVRVHSGTPEPVAAAYARH